MSLTESLDRQKDYQHRKEVNQPDVIPHMRRDDPPEQIDEAAATQLAFLDS